MSAEIKLSEEQIATAQEAFDKYDRRAQDKIRIGEIGNAFKEMGQTVKPDWLERVRDTVDEDETGYVTFDEFCHLFVLKLQADADEKELHEAFKALDKDNKGVIPVSDLRWILTNLGDDITEEEVDEMIAETDTDGSGTVDFEEFAHLMTSA